MKKCLSLILCLVIMVASLTLSGAIGIANAQPNDNLLADADVSSWGAYLWNNPANYAKAVLQNTDDSHHGGNSIYNYNVAFQNLYIALPTEAESNYNISFSIKTNNIMYINIFAVTKGADIPWNSNTEIDRSSASLADYSKLDGFTTSEAAWTDISLDLTTSSATDVQYYINIHFGDGGTSNAATISDLSLVKAEDEDDEPIVTPPEESQTTEWLQHQFNKEIVKTDDSHHGGEAIKNSSVAYQNLYKKLDVEANSNYDISFSIKANEVMRVEVFALESGTTPTWLTPTNFIDSNATVSYNMLAKNVPGTSESEWLDLKYTFTVGDVTNKNYYLNIHFGAGGDTNAATISDLSLVKAEDEDDEPIVTPPEESQTTEWFQHKWNSSIMKTDDSRYGGEAVYNTNITYQNLYKKLDLEPNKAYEISFSVKANEIMRIDYFALENGGSPAWDVNNYFDAGAAAEYLRLSDSVKGVSETDWVDFKATFITGSKENLDYYFNIHFGAKGINNDAIVSDVIVKEVVPGYLFDTELNYCEDFYNLALKTGFISGEVTSKTVIEIPLKNKDFYIFGATISGDGSAALAFDKEGTQIVKKLNINGKRNGFRFINQLPDQPVYLILEPKTKLTYKDVHLFLPTSVSTKIEMGKETNPNNVESNVYLTDAEIDEILKNPSYYQQSTSPDTGDEASALPAVLILAVTMLALILTVCRKKVKL